MMLKRSEIQKIEEKDKEWRRAMRHFNRQVAYIWGETKIEMEKIANFIWFYKPKSKGDKAWHVIFWLLLARAFVRIWWGV